MNKTDLSILNFKSMLVVLTTKTMKSDILSLIDEQEIDVNIKFTDSYFKAGNLINEQKFDPYDHVILNLSVSNKKSSDFLDFIRPSAEKNPLFLIEYTNDGELFFVEISSESDE
jgi:hypothetical protein